jgi:hypothetical protein
MVGLCWMRQMHFSADLTRLIGTMLEAGSHDGIKEVRQLTGLLGDHLWNEMDATRAFSDALHRDLAMELENGRLFRLMVKICASLPSPCCGERRIEWVCCPVGALQGQSRSTSKAVTASFPSHLHLWN